MKYTIEIEIDQPRDKVVELFDNEENAFKWMEGLQSVDPIEGEPGAIGSTSRMKFKMGKREIEMVETIIEKDLPGNYKMTYDAKGVHNIINNKFTEIGDNKTLYQTEQEFQFKGFMKVMGFLMPGAFKKQSLKYLKDFKAFAESGDN